MTPNSKVKLFLVNSLTAEGVVEYWSEDKVILQSNGKQLVVHNPKNNIIMYYVIELNSSSTQIANKKEEVDTSEKSLNENIKTNQNDAALRFKKIAELKTMAAETHLEQIRKELTTFHSINTNNLLGKYGTPSFISSEHNTSKKIDDGNAADIRSLSKMPGEGSK